MPTFCARRRALPVLPPLLILLSLRAAAAAAASSPASSLPPSTAPTKASPTTAPSASSTAEDGTASNARTKRAYIAIYRHKHNDLHENTATLTVLLDGARATDVRPLNATALSFRIPDALVDDPPRFKNAFVDIYIGAKRLVHVPLFTLKPAIVRVDITAFRQHVRTHTEHGSQRKPRVFPESELVNEANNLLGNDSPSSTEKAATLLQRAVDAGNLHAAITLASIHMFAPPPVKRDLNLASALLRNASAIGLPDAQALLAFLHSTGVAAPAVAKDLPAALVLWNVAARAGSPYAKMAMAFRLYYGNDVPEDCEQAAEYYREVAHQVFREALIEHDGYVPPRRVQPRTRIPKVRYKMTSDGARRVYSADLGEDDADDYEDEIRAPQPNPVLLSERKHLTDENTHRSSGEASEIVQYSQHLAERGDAGAQLMMGRLYYHGAADFPRDFERAQKLFELSARSGRAEAHAALGLVQLRRGRNDSAVHHLRIAAKRGEDTGLIGLAYANLFGIGVSQNVNYAVTLLSKAANKRNAEAVYNLGVMHGRGLGMQKSKREMHRHFEIAAQLGHTQAAYRFGVMLLDGEIQNGVNSCQQGAVYLKGVAQSGMWNKVLGRALRSYERSKYGDALMRYLRAAHAGIEEAQFNAAYMYEHGTVENAKGAAGVVGLGAFRRSSGKAHMEPAMEMYSMSAAQGNWEAMVRMGDLAFGTGVDYMRAMQAYERAVKMRSPEAMFNLGWMHARGLGMPADEHMAKRYFDMSMEVSDDAYYPAQAALLWLRHGAEFGRAERLVLEAWSAVKSLFGMEQDGLEKRELKEVMAFVTEKVEVFDVIVVSVLLGLLVLVVNARQRRLMSEARRQEEEVQPQEAENREGAER